MRGNLLLVTRSTTANAQVPRAESPGPIGRKKSGAVMGQFSGGCYLSLGIVVFLCLQFPTTVARGKNSLECVTFFDRPAVLVVVLCTCMYLL